MQPLLIRIILEHQLPAFQSVHHFAYDILAYRRTAMAAADTAVITDPGGIHVVGAVYNNRPLPGKVVETRFKTIEAKRIPVRSTVTFAGFEQTDAGLVALRYVGEFSRTEIAGIFAMGHQLSQYQPTLRQIKYPQALL